MGELVDNFEQGVETFSAFLLDFLNSVCKYIDVQIVSIKPIAFSSPTPSRGEAQII